MVDRVLGIDLNHYRKNVPLKTAKQQGVRFLLGKCTEGTSMVDETYHPYKLEAANKFLPFGGYMYWRVGFDAVKQAKHYVDTLGDTEFPPIVDVERINNVKYGTNIPLYSHQVMVNHLRIVLNEIERLTGRRPMIYTNAYSWSVLTGNNPMINEYEAWVANYGRLVPYLPIPLKIWRVWQWTSTYKIAGYYRGVDANWFNGNEAQFATWLASVAITPPPPPPPVGKDTVVTLEVVQDDGSTIYLLQPGDSLIVNVNEIQG